MSYRINQYFQACPYVSVAARFTREHFQEEITFLSQFPYFLMSTLRSPFGNLFQCDRKEINPFHTAFRFLIILQDLLVFLLVQYFRRATAGTRNLHVLDIVYALLVTVSSYTPRTILPLHG